MSEQTSSIIAKVWGLCNPLRDDSFPMEIISNS